MSLTERERARDRNLQRRHLRGEIAARDELIENYLPLATQLASRYRHRSEPSDDLNQVAYMGLLAAASRWDPERGAAFSSFAVPTILGELRRYFRDSTRMVRPPRDVQELWLRVAQARHDLWQELGRAPTARDVAAHIGATIEDVNDALQAGTIRRLRYSEDLLQREIAERVGCSQMHVSRILREAVTVVQHRAEPGADSCLASLTRTVPAAATAAQRPHSAAGSLRR